MGSHDEGNWILECRAKVGHDLRLLPNNVEVRL